jgi:hypothetical protein
MCSNGVIPNMEFSFCQDGRVCTNSRFAYSPAGPFAWNFLLQNIVTFSISIFVGILYFITFLLVIYLIIISKKKEYSQKNEYEHLRIKD